MYRDVLLEVEIELLHDRLQRSDVIVGLLSRRRDRVVGLKQDLLFRE